MRGSGRGRAAAAPGDVGGRRRRAVRRGRLQRRSAPHLRAPLRGHARPRTPQRARLERMAWSMSLLVVYFGTRRKYPGRAHHSVLFGPRYREMLREIFRGPSLPPDFSLYLHQPTVTDPSLAPPGGETFYVLAPVPHLGAADIDWTTAAEPYADRILASLETLLPDLRREVVVKRIATPLRLSRSPECLPRVGVLAGAAPHAERLLSPAQPRPAHPRPLHRRRGDAPGRGRAGRDQLGQGDGAAGHGRSRPRRGGDGVMTAGQARQALARRILRRHARSFSWAARLLPARVRDDATLLYAWCRRCDDAVDLAADPADRARRGRTTAPGARRRLRRARR